jgi:hypothetical protein
VLTIFLLLYFEHRQIWLNILIDAHLLDHKIAKEKHWPYVGVNAMHIILFYFQFCDVAKVAIIHKMV